MRLSLIHKIIIISFIHTPFISLSIAIENTWLFIMFLFSFVIVLFIVIIKNKTKNVKPIVETNYVKQINEIDINNIIQNEIKKYSTSFNKKIDVRINKLQQRLEEYIFKQVDNVLKDLSHQMKEITDYYLAIDK